MELAIPRKLSVPDYFRVAEASPTKLEYKAGELIDMAGATYDHNRVSANILGEMRNRLKGQPCDAVGSDTRLRVAGDRYCYPDVSVICGEPQFDPLDPDRTITNPKLIFEVLSPSTEAADRGEKFFRYIRLPSLAAYFLVSQHQARIESFVRQPDGSWAVGPVQEGSDASLLIPSLNIEMPLGEIYSNVNFSAK